MSHAPRFVRLREMLLRVGVSRSTAYALIKRNQFPAPTPLVEGGRAVAWLEADIDRWIAERIAQSRRSVLPSANSEGKKGIDQ